MTLIKDGRTGDTAAVNEQNELLVKAIRSSIEHIVSSRDGEAYYANTADTANTLTIATGETIKMLYLENTSGTLDLVVEKISVNSDTAGVVAVYTRNAVLGAVGANDAHTPPNANFSSGKTARVVCHTWDETGTTGITGITGGVKLATHLHGDGEDTDNIDGAIVLKRGNSLVVTLVNGTGGNVEAAVVVRFYFDRPEI